MKIKYLSLSLLFCCVFVSDAFSARLYKTAELNSLYGAAYWKICTQTGAGIDKESLGGGDADTPCIGNTVDKCDNKHGSPYITGVVTPTYGDEYGKVMVVARDANAHGAYFCPTSVIARNKNKTDAWTVYAPVSAQCFWLCKSGWTGDNCSKSVNDTVVRCDSWKIDQSTYKDVVLADHFQKGNVEDYVAMWGANYYDKCSSKWLQEHDLIFAISRWTASGHGAFARPYMIRARHNNQKDMYSWIEIYPAASTQFNYNTKTPSKLYCRIGYKPNSNGTDCVPINETICNTSWCESWDRNKFNSNNMTLTIPEVGTKCLQWRCAKPNYALAGVGSTSCSECVKSAKDGINPANGTCVHCGSGKFFDETASAYSYCVDAVSKTKTQLKYGGGSSASPIGEQCWTKDTVDEYKACVLGN